MSLIVGKLQKCEIGETIQLTMTGGEKFYGKITDKDEEALALFDGKEELVVSFDEIKSFKKASSDDIPMRNIEPVIPVYEKAENTVKKTPDYIKNKFSFEAEVVSVHIPDLMITQAFGELTTQEKKKLSSFYNKFMYGCKNNDTEKCIEASKQFYSTMQENNFSSTAVYKLLAFMNSRCKKNDAETYLLGGCYGLATIEYYVATKYDYCCACGAIALANNEESDYSNIALTAFAESTIKLNDAGGLYYAINKNPVLLTDKNIVEIIKRLASINGKTYSNSVNKINSLAELNQICNNFEVRSLANRIVGEENFELNNDQEKAGKIVGSIVKLSWASEKGTIESDDELYNFNYSDIRDNKLSAMLKKIFVSDLKANDNTISVEFEVSGESVKNISLHKVYKEKEGSDEGKTYSYLQKGREINANRFNENRFYDSLPYFDKAIQADENKLAAVTEAINCCMAIANQEGTSDYLSKAYSYYCNNKEVMDGKNLHSNCILGDLFFKLNKKEEYIDCLNRILSNPNLPEKTRMHYTFMKAETFMKIVSESDDIDSRVDYYENAKNELLSWESQYNNSLSTANNDAMRNMYYSRVLYDIAVCLYRTGDLDTAEETINTVLKNTPDNEKAKALMSEMIALDSDTGDKNEGISKEENEQVQEETEDDIYYEDYSEKFSLCSYVDCSGWDKLNITNQKVVDYLLNIKGSQRFPLSLAYLKAVSSLNDKFLGLYLDLSYALDNPMETLDYTLSDLVVKLNSSTSVLDTVSSYCIAAAYLRSVFYNNAKPDYIKATDYIPGDVVDMIPTIKPAIEMLEEFKLATGIGIDKFADYRFVNDSSVYDQRNEFAKETKEIYDRYFTRKFNEDIKQKRFKITKSLIFQKNDLLEQVVMCAKNNDYAGFSSFRTQFCEKFIKNDMLLSANNIHSVKIGNYVNEKWDLAGQDPSIYERKTSDLMGSLFNNLSSAVTRCVTVVCKWVNFCESESSTMTDEDFSVYQKTKGKVIPLFENVISECKNSSFEASSEIEYGCSLIENVCLELIDRLDGNWNYNRRKYYFCDFLRTDNILLDDQFLPDLTSTFCDLKNFNVIQRIYNHISSEDNTLIKHAESIYMPSPRNHDYGTARQIAEYLAYKEPDNVWNLPENEDEFDEQGKQQLWKKFDDFNCEICLAYNHGQLDNSDTFLNTVQETAQYWYQYCMKSKNYGFFVRFIDCCLEKIHNDALYYAKFLTKQLNSLAKEKNLEQAIVDDIAGYIEKQLFTIAEDSMCRITNDDYDSKAKPPEEVIERIKEFWKEFDVIYDSVKNTGYNLMYAVTNQNLASKDRRGGTSIINNWLGNGKTKPEKIQRLLELLGWDKIKATEVMTDEKEMYHVTFTEKFVGRKIYQHPIPSFGTDAENNGFYVVCLYGFTNAERLIDEYRKLDAIVGNKIVLLDFALGDAERRKLAKLTKITPLASTYLLIDRVAIMYVANHYISGGNNRTLMSITAPFSYIQPYVEGATNKVPGEMFIGRTNELLSIESTTGANLVYGGRQLGKSALLRKAEQEMDNREAKRYAIFVDIAKMNEKEAALKISKELANKRNGIISEENITDDWKKLTECISDSIENNDIGYLLLMIDEADNFIADCANDEFRPIVFLKDIQQRRGGKFKYVLAGLHNVVKFGRSVSLGNNSVIAHLVSIPVKPFGYEESKELLTNPLSYLGFEFQDESLIIQILSATNYYPSLIQLYCIKLIELLRKNYSVYNESTTPPYIITESVIAKILSDPKFKEEIKRKFIMTIDLTPEYYFTTLLLALLFCDDATSDGYVAADINRAANSILGDMLGSDDEINNYLEELYELNVLKKIGDKFSFRTKSFRDMLGSKEQIEDEIIKKLSESSL